MKRGAKSAQFFLLVRERRAKTDGWVKKKMHYVLTTGEVRSFLGEKDEGLRTEFERILAKKKSSNDDTGPTGH